MTQSFSTLPNEIVVKILEGLDAVSLVACKRLCRLLQTLIEGTASLQYTIELAVSGSEDGESINNCSIAERRQLLERYQNAWDTKPWCDEIMIPRQYGSLWELYGNILAMSTSSGNLILIQLPSHIRSIKQRQWVYGQDVFNFKIRDFTVDASQDLIVLIEASDTDNKNILRIHLRTLSTGMTHPQSRSNGLICHTLQTRTESAFYNMLVSEDHIGLHKCSGPGESELIICCWKTGELKLNVISNEIRSFVFMSSVQILALVIEEANGITVPTLRVIDFERESKELQRLGDLENEIIFRYPDFVSTIDLRHVSLRSDPAPLWTPDAKLGVPFQLARKNRIYVISFWTVASRGIELYVHFVPHITLQASVDKCLLGGMQSAINWEDWGPDGTRMIKPPGYNSVVYVCFVNGSRYVMPLCIPPQEDDNAVEWKCSVLLYDFNQLAFRRALHEAQPKGKAGKDSSHIPEDGETCLVTEEDVIEEGVLFNEEIQTRLRYRVRNIPLDIKRPDRWSVLCSEDGILLVDLKLNSYRLLAI